MQDDANKKDHGRRTKTYGRRKGKRMRHGQEQALAESLPRISVKVSKPISRETLNFPRHMNRLRLEIGFGSGEHLLHLAAQHPNIGFIGCEPFLNGVSTLLRSMSRLEIDNIRIHAGDAMDVVELLPDHSIELVYLLYPDPWPKWRPAQATLCQRRSIIQFSPNNDPRWQTAFRH